MKQKNKAFSFKFPSLLKVVCILLFLTCYHSSDAQTQKQKAKIITNKISSEYVAIQGTKISLIIPENYETAIDFKGIRNSKTGSSIMISSIPGNISTNLFAFTKQALQKSGIFVIGTEPFLINKYKAILIKAKQLAYQNSYVKWMLVIGNEKETYLVNGAYLEKLEKEESKIVLKSVLSTIFQPTKIVSAAEGFPFELDIKKTKLKAAKFVTNSLIFTTDGIIPTKTKDKTTVTASATLLPLKINDYKKYSINSIKQFNSIKEISEKNINELKIDGISGYEIFAYGINNILGKNELIYQTLLFNGDMSYSIVGIAIDEFESNLELFKNITKTFKLSKKISVH